MMFKETAKLWAYSAIKIPMIFAMRPKVLKLEDEQVEIVIPLSRHAKNHLNSMYFGALSVGADCAGGLLAMRLIQQGSHKVALVFKDFHAEFLKRAEGDTHFVCRDGLGIRDLVNRAVTTGERVEMPVKVEALVPSKFGTDPVSRFVLTLSLKRKD
ncbi:MAG: YiiD C-terminal domain-containing protein [Oligoflexia bacterium]|nr:YiiD C-terminal domain-containing protein [Oligoflexia bacterium]